MFNLHSKNRGASRSKGPRSSLRPQLEMLEDRVLLVTTGNVLVPTVPSGSVNPLPTTPIGIVAVNQSTGTQTLLTRDGYFKTPEDIVQAPNVTQSVSGNPVYIADSSSYGNASQALGAVIKYDFGSGSQSVVADSSSSLINQPVALTFLNGYLYVVNCAGGTNASLVRITPSTGAIQQVTITGGSFTVPTGIMPIPGDSHGLYVLDEGGFVNQGGYGQVWKEELDSTYLDATQSAYGPSFSTLTSGNYTYQHPQAITRDTLNPSSTDPIVYSDINEGTIGDLVVVHSSSFTTLFTAGPGDGLAMGSGPYTYTIFLCQIAYGGPPPNPIQPAVITAINRQNTGQSETLSSGNNQSSPTGMTIFQGNGGGATAPGGSRSLALGFVGAHTANGSLALQQSQLSGPTNNAIPNTSPMLLSLQSNPLRTPGEVTLSPEAAAQNSAVDFLFAGGSSGQGFDAFSSAAVSAGIL